MTSERLCKISECSKPKRSFGWCQKHYQRWWKHGDPLIVLHYSNPEEAFVARTDKSMSNGCWIWIGAKSREGYGTIKSNGEGVLVHRYSWELHNGPIPEGEGYHGTCVLHRCDNPSCVNPDHLFLGTNADNVDDMIAKGRGNKAKGEANGMSKLTDADIISIRADPRLRQTIAKDFGVSPSSIGKIKNNKTWKHVK